MGNFSRPPEQRLDDATSKHYVGVRVEQGVPLLDADLHLLDGLHRHALEQIGQWMLGNGVPVGSDGFRVLALPNGGVNTILLKAKTVGTALSSIEIDPVGSTAAAVLGFGANNATAHRYGDSPALLTGTAAQPFALFAGAKLIVRVDGGAAETIEFQPSDFHPPATISNASADDVVAKINQATSIGALKGSGNDFLLRGGNGTLTGAGRLLVDGRLALIERVVKYREQPLYQNQALATAWQVDVLGDIPTPSVNQSQTVFIDVWDREVDRVEDGSIVDARIDLQTAVSLRREWVVRVVASSDYNSVLAGRPPGHSFYPLAELKRTVNDKSITDPTIADLRETDLSLRPQIAYRNVVGAVVVDDLRFRNALKVTRDTALDFVAYLTTTLVSATATYLAGETLGLQTLNLIASVADQVLGIMNARALGTTAAVDMMQQLYDAEKRFVSVWQTTVLPLVKGTATPYQDNFGTSITLIKAYVDGPAPPGITALKTALQSRDLEGAVIAQERIAAELGGQAGKPIGSLFLKFLGSTTPAVLVHLNTPFDLKLRVSGLIAPDDDLAVQVFIDPGWSWSLKNGDGSTPFSLHGGPGSFTREFLVTITPPAVPSPPTLCSFEVHAQRNPGGTSFSTAQKTLTIDALPPPTEELYSVDVKTISNVVKSGNVYQVVHGQTAHVTFTVRNNTNQGIVVDLDPSTSATWTITPVNLLDLDNHPVVANGISGDFQWDLQAPGGSGVSLVFTLRAKNHNNLPAVLAEATLSLVST